MPFPQNLQSLAFQLEKMTQALKDKNEEANFWKQKAEKNAQSQSKPDLFQDKQKFEYEHELEEKNLEIQTLKNQCQNLEKGYVDQHQKSQELQSQNWKMNNNAQLLQNDNQQLQKEVSKLNNTINQLQNQNQNLLMELQQLRQNTQAKQPKPETNRSPQTDYIEKNYKGLLSDKDKKIEDYKKKINSLSEQNEELNQNVTKLQNDLKQQKLLGQELLKEEESRVSKVIEEKYDNYLNSLDNQIKQLKNEIYKKNELLEESHYRVRELENQIEELKKQEDEKMAELTMRLEREKNQMQFLIRPNEHLEFKVDQLNRELDSKVREINEKDGQIALLSSQIEKQIHQNVCLENENEVLKDRINCFGNKNDNNGDKVKIEYLKGQVEQLQKQLQEASQQRQQLQLPQPLQPQQNVQKPQILNSPTPNQQYYYYQQQRVQQQEQSAQQFYPQQQQRQGQFQGQPQNQQFGNQVYPSSPQDLQQNRKSGYSQNPQPRNSAQPYSNPDNFINGQIPFSAKGMGSDFLKTQRL